VSPPLGQAANRTRNATAESNAPKLLTGLVQAAGRMVATGSHGVAPVALMRRLSRLIASLEPLGPHAPGGRLVARLRILDRLTRLSATGRLHGRGPGAQLPVGPASPLHRRFWAAAVPVLALALPSAALGAGSGGSHMHHARTESRAAGKSVAVLLAPGSGYGSPRGSPLVRTVQRRLASAGFTPGPIDGRYGPRTLHAVLAFQATHGLRADGVVGSRTWTALTPAHLALVPGAGYQPGGSHFVGTVQRSLARAGYHPGPGDGRYGPLTEAAVRHFQNTHGLRATGAAGPAVLAAILRQTRQSSRHLSRHLSHPRANGPSSRPANASVATKAAGRRERASARSGARRSPEQLVGSTRPATHQSGASSTTWLLVLAVLGLAALAAAGVARRRGARRRSSGRPEGHPRQPRPPVAPPSNGMEPVAATPNGNGHPTNWHHAVRDTTANGDSPAPLATPDAHVDDAGDAFDLGLLLEEKGNLAGAQAAYHRAEENGHGPAASNLGVLLHERGASSEAEAAYCRADEYGDATGAFNLGVLLQERGAVAEAESAYRRAEQRGYAAAASNLGVLLEERGAPTEAEAAYRRADERGDATGAFNLGVLLHERGALDGAESAYRRAEERGDDEVARIARGAVLELDQARRGRNALRAASKERDA
jgi:peptidoglycan hydrolase-like protein with peptidoglycan-binding domain/tetratricopeptide (TPR) repeat protein